MNLQQMKQATALVEARKAAEASLSKLKGQEPLEVRIGDTRFGMSASFAASLRGQMIEDVTALIDSQNRKLKELGFEE